MSDSLTTGPRILCLDGGGMRGLSEILILKELMLQVRIQTNIDFTPEPWQCFDFICGTSTGGLLAVLLGRLGKTLEECEVFFRNFGPKIFSGSSVNQKAKLAFTGSKHASENLKTVIFAQAEDQMMVEESPTAGGRTPVSPSTPLLASLKTHSQFPATRSPS
jgi:patatin-like phospholipase/acyl hydrolase